MAWIGSDGSESKEGKDDSTLLASLRARGQNIGVLRMAAPVRRSFVQVDLAGAGKLDARRVSESNEYWQNAHAFGLIEGSIQTASGDTTLFLVVADEAEAQQIVKADPLVASGAFSSINYTTL